MLSNKDFAALLTSEDASLAASGGGKVRFDLKQISTWDKQNNSKFKKSKGAGGVTPNKPADSGDVDNTEDGVGKGKAGGNRGGYRDRAFERRKDINKEGDEMEAVASKLDAEQTKFLGGDMEHTHLVKGLDYALLRKVRGEAGESTSSGAQQASEPSRDDTSAKETRDYQPSTAVGMQIKMLLPLLSNRKSNDRSANLTSSKRGVVGAVAGGTTAPSASAPSSLAASSLVTTFARLGFDFDLNPASDVDIPTAIMGSKQEVSDESGYEARMSYMLPVSTLQRLQEIFGRGGKGAKPLKRKRKEEHAGTSATSGSGTGTGTGTVAKTAGTGPPLPTTGRPTVVDDFDIFEGVGKYVPTGALEAEEGEVVEPNIVPPLSNTGGNVPSSAADEVAVSFADADSLAGKKVKGIFSQLTAVAAATDEAEARLSATKAAEKDDLMAPVKAVLQAQTVKEKLASARASGIVGSGTGMGAAASAAVTGSKVAKAVAAPGMGGGDGSVIHRDIFGAGDAAVAARKGEAMWHGSYDIYPENGNFEGSDSDGEGGGGDGHEDEGGDAEGKAGAGKSSSAAAGAKKKPRTEGAPKGSGEASHGGSGGVGGSGGGVGVKHKSQKGGYGAAVDGNNRAARRAAAAEKKK